MLRFKQFLKEGPYSTPPNYANPTAPVSTHAKKTPDIPDPRDTGDTKEDFSLAQVDTPEENPSKRTSDGKEFPTNGMGN